jgi:HD domain
MIFAGLDDLETWDAVINAEPALAVVLSSERFDAALLAIANFVDLKSPYSLGHSRAVADLAAAAGARLGLSEAERRTLRRAGLVHDFGRLGVSNAIWDKRGPLGVGRMGARAPAPLPDRADASAITGCSRRWARSRCSTESASTAPATRADSPAWRSLAGPESSRPPTPTRRCANRARTGPRTQPTRRAPSCGPTLRPGGSTQMRWRRFSAPPGAQTARARTVDPGERQAARDLAEDRRQPHRAHLLKDRRLHARRGEPVRHAPRTPARGRVRS